MMRVLVPLDGSQASEEVLSQVATAAPEGTTFHLMHVIPVPVLPSGMAIEASKTLEAQAERYLKHVQGYHLEKKFRLVVRSGDAPESILKAALRYNVDLIAMTSHARTGLSRWILGSVAESVLRLTGLPVFLVRPGMAVPARPRRRILVPVDSWEASREIIDTVRGIALRTDAEVVLMHVVPKAQDMAGRPLTGVPTSVVDEARRRLQEEADRLEEAGLYAWSFIAEGIPGEEIVRHAGRVNAGMIAMTTHCTTGLERLVVGSVGQEVLRKADCPVLLQREIR